MTAPQPTLFKQAFDQAPVGMAVLDAEPASLGLVVDANPMLARIAGHALDELVGTDLVATGPPEQQDAERERLRRVAAGEVPRARVERRMLRPDDEPAWVQLEVSPLREGAEGQASRLIAHVQDVTERKAVATELEARAVTTRVLAQAATVDGALSALLSALGEVLGFQLGVAWAVRGEELRCQALWESASLPAGSFSKVTREVPLAIGSGLPGRVWQTREPAASPDLARDPSCPRVAAAAADGLHAAVAFPILVGSELHGVLELVSTVPWRPDAHLMRLLGKLSSELAGLLARKRAQERQPTGRELLLVEDNAFIARLVGEMLSTSETPLDLVHVERLSEARDRLVTSPPTCILLDLTLPDADGLHGLLEIRQIAPDVPLVVLTATEDEQLAVRAVREGAQDYLVKRKIDMQGLARSIRYAIERKDAEQQLLEHRLRDPVTGLPNRMLFVDRLQVALKRSERGSVAVLLVNLDRFRLLNESLGHESGDALLIEMAGRLLRTAPAGTTVASFGGDEFAVLLEGGDERAATELAEAIAAAIAVPFEIDGEHVPVTATVGVALGLDTGDAEKLVARADTALTRGKELGGGRCEVFDEAVRVRLRERLSLETGLRNAIEKDELRLLYQPIVSLASGDVVAFEALLRWEREGRGLVSPGEFLPLAEESGLIVPIGEWTLTQACRQLAAWRRAFPKWGAGAVNVNLSARQLSHADLAAVVEAVLRSTGVPPRRLCLEVTETALVADLDASVKVLHELKDLGVQLALDDFGTGYSSLSYLERFPIDVLKLDRSFVSTLRSEERKSAIVAAVATMAGALGLPALAEGIEEEDEVAELRALGYELGQGFHFAKPLPAAAAALLLPSGSKGSRVST